MKKENLKQILNKYYSLPMVRALMRGFRTPQLKTAIELEEQHNIPVCAWKDIKSFISSENSTTNSTKTTNIKKIQKVSS